LLPDLQGFSRREMKIAREEPANCLILPPPPLSPVNMRGHYAAIPWSSWRSKPVTDQLSDLPQLPWDVGLMCSRIRATDVIRRLWF
jgi:hypothetical protein